MAGGKKPIKKKKDRAAEVANTFEWLITAFVLAFVFRAFVMEAFRIPTGSMADTLMGAHFRLRCPQCGYQYEFGYNPGQYGRSEDTIPLRPESVRRPTRCPSCGYHTGADNQTMTVPVANGDRILVFKCLYQFSDPKRWDVIVFKNPTDPTENYIKRLIGLPGETIEIIDGDVYIDGQIARKPADVQKELWMPVYDNDFRPVNPNLQGAYNGYGWRPPFNFDASAWKISDRDPTRIVLDSPVQQTSTLTYGARSANDFTVAYAYNELIYQTRAPECSDLMMRFYVEPQGHEGRVGISLSKYGVEYRAWVDLAGEMVLARADEDEETVLVRKPVETPRADTFTLMKFAVVDHQLLFAFGNDELKVDMGRSPDALGRNPQASPQAAILGAGKLTLAHIALFRDIYYTDGSESPQQSLADRAIQGRPFTLDEDEFFALGDNSPNSLDGRYWQRPTEATKGTQPPRAGVVPRHYLVGKALFVYWPSGFEFPWPGVLKTAMLNHLDQNPGNGPLRVLHGLVSLRWIPNFGQMRFIHGGRNSRDTFAETTTGNQTN
jgi:signal peptidase I